jgi:hypothetical protein
MEEFIADSIDPAFFQVENVANDNACFYRAVSNGLLSIIPGNTCSEIVENIDIRGFKDISEVYENALWGIYGDEQDDMAKYVQQKAYEWNISHSSDIVQKDIGFTIEDYITNTHLITMDEYKERYCHFAGEIAHTKIDTGKTNKNGEKVYREMEVGDRWGGYSEQLALSKFLKLPIIVYISQKYDIKNTKIITGKIRNNKPEKGVRFKTYQSTGLEFMDTSPPITLLWKKTYGDGHYMALYKTNEDILFNKMGEPYVK